jgi:hypothetical protein
VFGSEILDVFIGLFLVYWVFSIIASSLTEAAAGFSKQRGNKLKDGIKLMLQGDDTAVTEFFNHPVMKALRPVDGKADQYPSYVSPPTFARVYLSMRDELKGAIPQKVIDTFGGAVDRALDDGALQKQIEGWFNETMDRATGWYKRWSKKAILIVGLVLVVLSNADTISITNSLWQDPAGREIVVKRAEVVQTEEVESSDVTSTLTRGNSIKDELTSMSLIGWVHWDEEDDPRRIPLKPLDIALKIIGLGMTTAAVAMGAPFWFDIMGKLLGAKAALTGKSSGGSGGGGGSGDDAKGNGGGDAPVQKYHPPIPSTTPGATPAPPTAGSPGTAGTQPTEAETPGDDGPPPVPPGA